MKTILLLLISATTTAQAYLGLGLTNEGALYQAGALIQNVQLELSYKMPLMSNDVNKVLSVTTGYQYKFITASLGGAYTKRTDYKRYNADPTGRAGFDVVEGFKPIVSVELGIDKYLGRIFINGTYCGVFYFGVGLKVYTHTRD